MITLSLVLVIAALVLGILLLANVGSRISLAGLAIVFLAVAALLPRLPAT